MKPFKAPGIQLLGIMSYESLWNFLHLNIFFISPIRTQEGQTALQLAISNQLPLVVDAICTRGADMSVVNDKGDPPLWLALENGLEDIASTLVWETRTLLEMFVISRFFGMCSNLHLCFVEFLSLTTDVILAQHRSAMAVMQHVGAQDHLAASRLSCTGR